MSARNPSLCLRGRDELKTRPAHDWTLFQATSISKPVTALAVLRLVETGKLQLEEDINLALKSWQVPANDYTARENVTVRRILSHTAGLTVHGFRGYAARSVTCG